MRWESKSTILSVIVCLVAVLGFASQKLWAQMNASTISGTVTDSSGAVVPGVAIIVLNQDTGSKVSAKTNSVGSFVVAALPVGVYSITVSKEGFTAFTEKNIRTEATQVNTVNPVLSIGAVSTHVEVSATEVEV